MRVLCIATAYPRHAGDHVTPWLPELIRRLLERDVEVEVLASAHRGSGDQTVGGVAVHRFRYAPAALEYLTHDRSAPAQLRRSPHLAAFIPGYIARGRAAAAALALSGRFDVVHALWPVPHALVGAAAKRAGRIPLVSTFFGSELAWHGVARVLLAPLVREAVRVSDAVTCISRYAAGLLQELAPSASPRLIALGAAIDAPAVFGGRPNGRPTYDLLYVGRLTRRKGIHVLLDALARTPSSVTLNVVGEGVERSALEARAARLGLAARVRLHGFLSREALADRYAQCDALVLPSLEGGQGDVEGLGLTPIEGLSFGKPVIASAVGGIAEVVRDGVTGLLVAPGDVVALAAAISALSRDGERGRAMGAAGREYVARHFAWPPIIDALVDVYESVRRRPSAA